MALVDQGHIDPFGGYGGLLSSPRYGTIYNPPETGGGLLSNPLTGMGASALFRGAKSFFNGGNPFTSAGASLANAGAGWLGSKLGTWGDGNAGSSIGGAVGGFAGSFLPVPALGTLLGSAIGSAIGGNFGPPPTVGPNAQAWLGNQGGRLGVMGSSGDNGLNASTMPGLLGNALNYANQFPMIGELPRHFQVRGGENRMQPTIEIGGFMAPMLNDQSLARAMAKRGLLNAPGIGEDPTRIFTGTNWVEPESIHPLWAGGIHEVPNTGFLSLDTGRVGNAVPQAYARLAELGVPANDSTLRQFALGAYG